MCKNRDYEIKYLIYSITTNYQEQVYLYNNVALREVWTQYAFKCCTNIYQHG